MVTDEVEVARALLYRLLTHALAAPPDAVLLGRMAALDGDEGPLGSALRALADVAGRTTVEGARREYDALFIGVARGEVLPYASYYLTGFLHERPLARLRAELGRLGLARADGRTDPEDHMATLCDVMAGLIEAGRPEEAEFFARHVGPWAAAFFADLERAASADLYRPIGTLGRVLIELDRQGYEYAEDGEILQGAA